MTYLLPVAVISADVLDHMTTEPTIWVPEKMYGRLDQARRQEVAKKILQSYFKDQPLGNDSVNLIGAVSSLRNSNPLS